MDIIHSSDNLLIKETRKLKEKKYRTLNNEFIVEGFRFVIEALESSFEVTRLFVSDIQENRFKEYAIADKLQKATKVHWVKEQILKSLSDTDTPQGIIAVVKNQVVEIADKSGFYVLVDKIQDPGNLGTIIRTADAASALGVIYTKGTVDVYNEKTLRSTMGSIFHIPIISDEDLSIVLKLKEKGFKLVVSELQAEHNFFDVVLKDKIVIAVGNEGNGISDLVHDISDIAVKIPMPGKAESLNASVAASIMMYEYVRQNLS